MSKNKFKKFKKKKHLKHHHAGPVQVPIFAQPVADIEEPGQKSTPVEENEQKITPEPEETAAEYEEYSYVRKDVKKILIVIGSIFVLLFVAYYINLKTPFFHSMGNWLYNALNIQTQ